MREESQGRAGEVVEEQEALGMGSRGPGSLWVLFSSLTEEKGQALKIDRLNHSG